LNLSSISFGVRGEYAAALRLVTRGYEYGCVSRFVGTWVAVLCAYIARRETANEVYILSAKEAATSFWLRCGCGWLDFLRLRFFESD